ncbi:MAG TPA: hypothetical protein VIY48_19130 [Candidatus Paceibacterota bacterium]
MYNPDECPAGADCPVHNRLDSIIHRADYFSAITYVGEYVVFTDLNPRGGMVFIIEAAIKGEPCPDMFATSVLKVGSEGTLYDCYDFVKEEVRNLRFIQTHDDENNVENAHLMVVEAVKNDMLDLSNEIEL